MPKKVDHDERRGAIAEALLRLASTDGLEAVSLRNVAAEAGISMGAVQHYFANKDDMLHFALEYSAKQRERRIVEALSSTGVVPTTREILRAIALEVLPLTDRSRAERLVGIAFFVRAAHDPRLAAAITEGMPQVVSYIAELLTQAGLDGRLVEGVDPYQEALVYWSVVDSQASSAILGERTVDEAIATVDYHLSRLFA